MSISVSVTSKLGSDKSLWAWSVSTKNNKFGSTKTKSTTVGALVAVHSALSFIPPNLDVIIRTHDKKIVEILSNVNKSTKNPLISKLFSMIRGRDGFVRCIYVSPAAMKEEDKRAVKIVQTVSGGSRTKAVSVGSRSSVNSLIRPSTKTVKVTTKRRKKVEQPLTTGLGEEWDDDYDTRHLYETKAKPVLCGSCDAPISPLTNECMCSN